MFERFTSGGREVVVRAQAEAAELGHCWIGPEHLALGILAHPEAAGVEALHRFGVTRETWLATLRQVHASDADFGTLDKQALSALGIDIDEVRHRVESTFGPGALDVPPRRGPRRRFGRRSRRAPTRHLPFTDRAKRALERSLREALALGDRHIGVEHVLLGLLDPKGNFAVHILERLNVQPTEVRAAVLSDLGRAA